MQPSYRPQQVIVPEKEGTGIPAGPFSKFGKAQLAGNRRLGQLSGQIAGPGNEGPSDKVREPNVRGASKPGLGGTTWAPGNAMVGGKMRYVGTDRDYGMGYQPPKQTIGRRIGEGEHFTDRNASLSPSYGSYGPRNSGSGLNSFDAQKQTDPVTGLSMEPSTFELSNKRRELAKSGEWDALHRMNAYYKARQGGNADAIGAAADSIQSFRAIRQAKQQAAMPQPTLSPPLASATNPPASDHPWLTGWKDQGGFNPVRQAPVTETSNQGNADSELGGHLNRINTPYGTAYSINLPKESNPITPESLGIGNLPKDKPIITSAEKEALLNPPPMASKPILAENQTPQGRRNIIDRESPKFRRPIMEGSTPSSPSPQADGGERSFTPVRQPSHFWDSPLGQSLSDLGKQTSGDPGKLGKKAVNALKSSPGFQGSILDKWYNRRNQSAT